NAQPLDAEFKRRGRKPTSHLLCLREPENQHARLETLMIDSLPITNSTAATTASRAAPAIEANDLVKTYGSKVRALDGLGFAVEAGTIFALLGPNGAGKSTTVKILNTLSRPDSGSARVAGFDVLRDPQQVRLAIGCVAQKSGIDMEATGREN